MSAVAMITTPHRFKLRTFQTAEDKENAEKELENLAFGGDEEETVDRFKERKRAFNVRGQNYLGIPGSILKRLSAV